MRKFDTSALRLLLRRQDPPCVSLYSPTHQGGRDGEDEIRWKNLLGQAEQRLSGHWMSASNARDMLAEPAAAPNDPAFWTLRRQGVAAFISPTSFDAFHVDLPLNEQVFVANRFRFRPLLRELEQERAFYLLVVSENRVTLYHVDETSLEAVEVPGLPASMSESLNYDSVDRGAQVHSAMRGPQTKQGVVFHGQGGQPDASNEAQLVYCANIDKAVSAWLGQSSAPLLIAAVESLAAKYRGKNSYDHLLAESLAGNQDYKSEQELHEAAWRVAQPLLSMDAEAAAERYRERRRGESVSDDPREIVAAAVQGRVDTLFYDPHAEWFGECDPTGENVAVSGKSEDDDLVDLAAIETIRHRGVLFAMSELNIPTNKPMAAILRYR